jgi:hypothetical protein
MYVVLGTRVSVLKKFAHKFEKSAFFSQNTYSECNYLIRTLISQEKNGENRRWWS